MQNAALIIPAAGLSRRHPPNKLLAWLGDQRVIEQTLKTFLGFPLDLYVVVGHQEEEVREVLIPYAGRGVTLVTNPEFESGMASSLRTGFSALPAEAEYAGISLGDKPFIERKTIETLLAVLAEKKPLILIPEFEGERGHPVFFRRELFEELRGLEGEMGGREIIARCERDVLAVPVQDAGITLDMDGYLESTNV